MEEMKAELLQAMQSMIEVQNWQGYLHFRRTYISNGGEAYRIHHMIRVLPEDVQIAYGRFFSNPKEVSKQVAKILRDETNAKLAERQAKYERRTEERATNKPIKR